MSEYERLSFRIDKQSKKIIKTAADILGMTITEFIINSADEAATKLINERLNILDTCKIQDEFIDAIKDVEC